ncbi:hypothetical protein N9X54_07975 [Planktomarina temperata]|nr:hypothetical protein [Planktomarina temperata]
MIEIANMYFYDEQCAKNISAAFPDAKIYIMLRNPFERLLSAARYRVSVGEVFDCKSVEDVIKLQPDILRQSLVYTNSKPWIKYFGDNVNFMKFDEMQNEPQRFFASLLQDNSLALPSDLSFDKKKNVANNARNKHIIIMLQNIKLALRYLIPYAWVDKIANTRIVKHIAYTHTPVVLEDNLGDATCDELNYQIKKLGDLLGESFDHWLR